MNLSVFLELSKIRITGLVTITMFFGYVLSNDSLSFTIIIPAMGLFLIAVGSSVINHYQERKTDSLMVRTNKRPLPSGRITVRTAILYALSVITLGSFLMYFNGGIIPLMLAWLALIWYNVIYTPLKKRTSLAVIPGSVIGAIPPVIGWILGGGALSDPKVFLIAFFFFIWQVPHFWLLLLLTGKDYEKAGFPTIHRIFDVYQIARLIFVWTFVTAITPMLFPLFGLINASITFYVLVLLSGYLVYTSFKIVKIKNNDSDSDRSLNKDMIRVAFKSINYFVLLAIIIISIDSIIKY